MSVISKTALKSAIDAQITANGTNSITGTQLNTILNNMVDSYQDYIRQLTTTQIDALTPTLGMFVYDSTVNKFRYYNGSAWIYIVTSISGWGTKGNVGTDSATDYVGTTDGEPLIIQPDNSNVGIGTDTPNGFEINKALAGDAIGKFIIDDDIFGFPLNLMFAGFGSPDGEYWGMAETIDDTLERGIADIGWKNQNTQDSRHIKLGNNDVGEYPADDGRFLVIEAYDTTPFARGKYNFRPHSIDVNFDSGEPTEERYNINLLDGIADNKLLMVQNTKTEMNFVSVSEILATLPSYASDAAAAGGGLAVGDSYFSTSLSAYTRRLV